jgi:hypothetical protein
MTPAEFIAKWRNNALSERAGAQSFFLDLCALLGVPPPNDPENYCFERGATRTGAGHGWADVWMRNYFAWENKAPGRNLADALKQLMTYALALDNPPLLVVCDREIIQIHTHFTGTPSEVHTILLADIGAHDNLQKLRWLFTEPERFKPRRTVRDVTSEAAGRFARVAQALTGRGHDPLQVAHFLIQCLFSMFAEDAKLLPEKLFERVIEKSTGTPEKLAARLAELFASMRAGGEFLLEDIAWFNGGLFETTQPLPLAADEVATLLDAAKMDWSHIEPSIFGTLFERGLDPALRSQLGANYTDPQTIAKLIEPVIIRPLAAEWATAKAIIAEAMAKYHAGGKGSQTAYATAQATFLRYIERLKNFRVLDPACGSGNFLYLALRALKDLEHRANLDAEALGLHRQLTIETSPANVLGLEINPYAAELARVTVWIGEIQWMLKHGYDIRRNPILSTLDHVECRDALVIVGADGTAVEAEWPECDAIVGNPPFLGDKKMRGEMGDDYVTALRQCYAGRVPGGADLVTYWFEKARAQIEAGQCSAAGLVATNSIRGGANRKVLDRIVKSTRIFEAWGDEPWINDGAAVRVSLVCFGSSDSVLLVGSEVGCIHSDLTAGEGNSLDLTQAQRLDENAGVSFMGVTKSGPFDLPSDLARQWLPLPNPHGRPNTDVLSPSLNGQDLAKRPSDEWIVNFGNLSENDASLYEAPFAHALQHIKPERQNSRTPKNREIWWRFERSRPEMFAAFGIQPRYIATCLVAKHRFFVWVQSRVVPENVVIVIARADDTTFGILHSRFHELWSLRLGTSLEDRPRYTPTTTFETFPFPAGLTPRDTAQAAPTGPHADAIASAAQRLNELRENWLNPAEWTERIPEIVPGYPDRIVAKPGHEAELKKRTLTNLYNARPAWLNNAHQTLDAAVATAYGWPDYAPAMPDAEILKRLLTLNLARKAAEATERN